MNYKQVLLTILLVCTSGIQGCASYQSGIVDIRPAEQYPSRTAAKGLALAVDPYDSKAKAESAFYIDVTSEGFYPVNLIFRNDTKDRVIVLRDTVELIDPTGNTNRPVRYNIMFSAFEKSKMAYALLGFGIFSYMSAEDANRKMETDWRQKELPEQLIIQTGRRADGFVYFRLPPGRTPQGGRLLLEAELLETKEKIPLEVLIVSGF
jgi:hypothetical protein